MVVSLLSHMPGLSIGASVATRADASIAQFLVTVPHASGSLPHWIDDAAAIGQWGNGVSGTHFALDRGALNLGVVLAPKIGASVIPGSFSRLCIDLNRPIDDATAIEVEIAGTVLAVNAAVSPGDLAARRHAHRAFHQQLAKALQPDDVGNVPFLIDLHSFDRRGPLPFDREVDVGICAPSDSKFAEALFAELRSRTIQRGITRDAAPAAALMNVRWNEPYSADHPGAYLMRRHVASSSGGAVIEICDDLLTVSGINAIADLLAATLQSVTMSMTAAELPYRNCLAGA